MPNTDSYRTLPHSILLVEDNNLIRCALRRAIESVPGVRVVGEAADVPEAMVILSVLQPAIAILDLRLPSGSGLEVLDAIRRTNRDCRVIIFSGTLTDWEASLCRFAGADHCFHKVRDFDNLLETLHRYGRVIDLQKGVADTSQRPLEPGS